MIDEFNDLSLELARYFHAEELCQNPDMAMDDYGDLPGIYIDQWFDQPTNAYVLSIVEDDRDAQGGDCTPAIFVRVVSRGETHVDAERMAGAVFQRLHDATHLQLTATTVALLSRRVIRTRATVDQNDRHIRVDTYRINPERL